MITHRKTTQLRIRRSAYPQAPFWQAVTIAPYGTGRGMPVQINYMTLTADAKAKVDVSVTRSVRDQLERERVIEGPALIEASEVSELIYRRGEEALTMLTELEVDATCLISSNGHVPSLERMERATIVVSCWPLRLQNLEMIFQKCHTRGFRWGVIVPLIHPVTTDFDMIERLADLAAANGASFFTGVPIESEPEARQAVAVTQALDDAAVTELFDADLESMIVSAERFGARVATARDMLDHVPAFAPLTSNWLAAMKLSLAGTRLIRMGEDVELGWTLHQSSKLIAGLHKPIERIAASASLSIIESLDETSVEALEQWLRDGRSGFFESVDAKWRG